MRTVRERAAKAFARADTAENPANGAPGPALRTLFAGLALLSCAQGLAQPAHVHEAEPGEHWTFSVHGYAFLTANRQGGPSGDRDFASQNHFMVAATGALGGGTLSLVGTFTAEPVTIPPRGSFELFQRGETYDGVLLVDRQHPHDLFVELAARWDRSFGAATVHLYAAPVGEPAIGPVAYPHRLSASEDPIAPLAHHNQDSTHISYDVLGAGLTIGPVTLEGSAFHGAEPDENRFNLEAGAIDSYSGRARVMPFDGLELQVSVAHLEKPEAIEPGNQTRATASAAYTRVTPDGFVAVTAITGRNETPEGPEWGHTLEATWKFLGRNFVFARLERVDRDLYELRMKRQRPEDVPHVRTSVDAGTLGAVRELGLLKDLETGLGAALTLYRFDSSLDDVYGRHPLSAQLFLRVRFGSHDHSAHGGHAGHVH